MTDTSLRAPAIKVFLVDDQQLVRSGLRMLSEAQGDMRVVGVAGGGALALAMLAGLADTDDRADVVLMDIRMPVLD